MPSTERMKDCPSTGRRWDEENERDGRGMGSVRSEEGVVRF
jgi:hypothetical protein